MPSNAPPACRPGPATGSRPPPPACAPCAASPPRPWRTTAAFVGWSEELVCDWHRHFTAPVVPDAWGQVRPEDRQRLSQLILLHEAPDEGCVLHQADLRGEGLVVDLADGRTTRITAAGPLPQPA